MLKSLIPKEWNCLLKNIAGTAEFSALEKYLTTEYKKKLIYPKKENIFKALHFSKPADVKVVILGQDPYHGENQAHGLSFSVPKDQKKIPPSLRNIRKELEATLEIEFPDHGCLEGWASQGVLLLNAVLTVEASKAGSHQKQGWECFTNYLISELSKEHKGIVFLLWGSFAHKKEELIPESDHLILKSVHPSPLSAHRGFFGNHHFGKANKYLESQGRTPIDWNSL